MTTTELSALVAKEVRAQLAYDADCAISSPITEIFSFFLMKPALQQTYRNYKTWRFTKKTLQQANSIQNDDARAKHFTTALIALLGKNIEDLRTRMYFSKKALLKETLTGLPEKLTRKNKEQQKAALDTTTSLLKALKKRACIRFGFSLIQLTCKIAFAAGAVFAVMSPLSWIGLPILGTAAAISLLFRGINRFSLKRTLPC